MIITSQHVHSRNWMVCPRCDGLPLTEKQAKAGFQCGTCFNKGEVPRFTAVVKHDNSSLYEKQVGA
jgi:hypothetical protein